jgi:hypothetical protein
MKKIILFLVTFLFIFASEAQILFSEDFDGIPGPTAGGAGTYTFPSGWLLRNVDNRTPNAQVAYVNEAWERREDFGNSVVDSAAFSTSYYSPLGSADDWMWTPPITITNANTNLKWNARAYDGSYPDGYEVRVMTSPNIPSGGTGVLGNQVSASTMIFSTAAESSAWTAHQIPLGAYNGQTIRIAFRNNSNDKFILVIDDVVVEVIMNHNLYVVSGSTGHGEYTAAPANQQTTTQNFELKGSVFNAGVQACTNVMLGCDISVGGTFLTTVQSVAVPTAAVGSTTNFTIPFTPVAEGAYTFKFYPILSETEEDPANDTITDPTPLLITPLNMRRDNGSVVGQLGIGSGNGGYLGQTFRFETAVNLGSVSAYVTRGYTNEPCAAAIFNTDASGVPTTFLATTDTLFYPDDSARLYTMPIHGGTLNLPAGEYAVLFIEFDSTAALGQTSALFTANSVYVNWPTNPFGPAFAPVENFGSGFTKSFMLYPDFDVCYGLTGGTLANTTSSFCYQSTGTAEVTLEPGFSILWEDSTTNAINASLGAGFHTYTLSNAYCSFIDSVEITNPSLPTATVSAITEAFCSGTNGTITLDVQNGTTPYTYGWSDGSDDPVFTGPAGTYSVVITDSSNCQTSLSDIIITNPAPPAAAVSTVTNALCFGDNGTVTLDIQGGSTPYTYIWSDGSMNPTFTGSAGTYSVMVTDSSNCQTTVNDITITQPDQLETTGSSTNETCTGCNDGTATMTPSGGTAPYAFDWSNGATGNPVTGLTPGSYIGTVTDANGCTTTFNFDVTAYGVGLNELSNYGISIYPNPVVDYLTIAAPKGNVTGITLIDASGRVIGELTPSNNTFTADMTQLAKGVYQLVIRTSGGTIATSVTKQ